MVVGLLFTFIDASEVVHRIARVFIGFLGFWPLSSLSRYLTCVSDPRLSQVVLGMTFKNPIGLAGGLAKDKLVLTGLENLGFGFLEIGTFTKSPQAGNPKPRLFRYLNEGALINRMGFNNLELSPLFPPFFKGKEVLS